jgi:hypothetical protein
MPFNNRMASKEYKGRRWEIYFPSEKFLQEWQAEAKRAHMSLSSWIFETVESNRAALSEAAQLEDISQENLRAENRKLRRELERTMADLERHRTETFKLRNETFTGLSGKAHTDRRLIEVLLKGGTWPSRELLRELDVSPVDSDAMKILIAQLNMLQDLGLIQEGVKGWRWI